MRDELGSVYADEQFQDFSPSAVSYKPKDIPPAALRICSPYDRDARYARNDEHEWVGYRTHLT